MEYKRGTRLAGRYEIIELIGSGGFGSTYKAIDHLLSRYVAIKCSDKSLSHEAKILKAINDVPHISHIYDYFVYDNRHFVVMRLITGMSLAEFRRLNGGTISVAMIKQLLPSAIITLDQMHERGIIHRDISPGNFIISEDNIMYLIDFGAATSTKELRLKNHGIFRHAGLESPEQLRDDLQGPWSDVFSLCVTIVFLLTGEGIPSVEDRVKFDPVPGILTRLSLTAKMQNALINGLSPDASKRYQTVKAFAADFFGKSSADTLADKYSVHYHAKTFIGERAVNQDNFMVDTMYAYAGEDCEIKGYIDCNKDEYHVVAIADGVASSHHAELASKAAIQAVSHFIDYNINSDKLAENLIEEFLLQANEKINILSEKIGSTATTLTMFLWKNNEYCIANVGDSPIYRLSKGRLEILSKEHTLAREKIEAGGEPNPRDFHTLTRYLGKKNHAGSDMAHITTGIIESGDIFLLCSDGVAKVIPDNILKRYMKIDGDKSMRKIYTRVSKHSNSDNCTAVILKF